MSYLDIVISIIIIFVIPNESIDIPEDMNYQFISFVCFIVFVNNLLKLCHALTPPESSHYCRINNSVMCKESLMWLLVCVLFRYIYIIF